MPFSFQTYRRARERDIVIILRTVKNQKTEHGVRLALFMQPAGPVCSAARCPRSANTRKTAGSFRRTFCCRHGEPYRSGKTPLCRTVQKPCSHHAAPHAFHPPRHAETPRQKTKSGERNESAPHCLLHLEMLCCLCLRCCEGFVFYLPVRLGRRKALFSPLMNAQRLLARGSLLGGGLFLRRRRRFLRRTLLGRV